MLYLDLMLFLPSYIAWLILISNIDIIPVLIFFSILKYITFISFTLSNFTWNFFANSFLFLMNKEFEDWNIKSPFSSVYFISVLIGPILPTLNTAAVCLMKIANDIRFLGSGPRAGYGELVLPENEPGSSIMPGKVNPTQCEAVTMVCVKVIGNHNGITMAGSHGHFELNVFKALIIHNVLQSIQILSDSTKSFAKYCISGLKADKNRIKHLVENSLMLVTALSPKIGYDNAAKIAKNALKNKTTFKAEALKSGLINEREYNKIVDPNKMIKPD